MLTSNGHRSPYRHRTGVFVFMADRRLLAKSVEARRFVFMVERSRSAKSVEARRFGFMADRRLLAKSVEARRFVFMADASGSAKMMSVLQLVKLGRPSPEPRESFSRERDGELTENTLAYFIHFGTCLLTYLLTTSTSTM